MRIFIWMLGLTLMANAASAVPLLPDLDVTHISITPRPYAYSPNYNAGYGRPTDPNTNQVISLEQAQGIPHYHAPGDPVTLTARVVNHGGAEAGPFTWEWRIDGNVVSSGSHAGLLADAVADGNG